MENKRGAGSFVRAGSLLLLRLYWKLLNCYCQVHRSGVNGTGHMERTSRIPGRRCPRIPSLEGMAVRAAQVSRALFCRRRAILPDDQNVFGAAGLIIDKRDRAAL